MLYKKSGFDTGTLDFIINSCYGSDTDFKESQPQGNFLYIVKGATILLMFNINQVKIYIHNVL